MADTGFNAAFVRLISHEGGFQKDRADRGNWTGGQVGKGELRGTKYGISAMSYPQVDIAGLTLDQAKRIYERDFWVGVGCERVPEKLRFDLFDVAVNSGPGRAVRFLQKAAGVKDDGKLGPITLKAIAEADPEGLLARFNGHRLDFLNDLDTWPTYGRGWVQRIAENLMGV